MLQHSWLSNAAKRRLLGRKHGFHTLIYSLAAHAITRFPLYWLLLIALLTLSNLLLSLVLLMNNATKADSNGIRFNYAVFMLALSMSLTVGIVRPAWWRSTMIFGAGLPIPLLLITSGNLAAGCTTLFAIVIASGFGREIAAKLPGIRTNLECWVIGGTIGFGLIAACGFILGTLGELRPLIVWALLGVAALGLLVKSHTRLWRGIQLGTGWIMQPVASRPLQFLLVGAGLACFWLNLLGALTPEILSDAVRQRLPASIQFAQSGDLYPHDPEIIVATAPALGEMVYGVILTISPLQGAKLTHFLVGIVCTGAVFALGQRLGGVRAGGIGALAFYGTLITAYLSQSSYLDLFTGLFAVTATLILVLHRKPTWQAAVLSGICVGLGVAVKVHFAYVAVGILVTIVLLTLRRSTYRQAAQHSLILIASAFLAAGPWLLRSALLTGQIPGLALTSLSLIRGADEQPAALFDLVQFGYGRSLQDLVALPFTVIFTSLKFGGGAMYGGVFGGHIGYLPLALAPLLLVSRRQHRSLAILVGTLVAIVLWFYTAQYLRYGFPLLAIVCALGGAAYQKAWNRTRSTSSRRIMSIVMSIIALSGIVVRMQLPDIGHAYAFGFQDRETFLDQHLTIAGAGTYQLLQLLDKDPTVTRVFALPDGARLYTHVRISSPLTSESGRGFHGDDETILRQLRANGYSHILLDRRGWAGPTLGWDTLAVIDEDFLQRHTELVAGGDHNYLYRIVYPDQGATPRGWVTGTELLPNGDFEQFKDGQPTQWELTAGGRVDNHSTTQGGNHVVHLTMGSQLIGSAFVDGGVQYLLASKTQSTKGYGTVQVEIEWRDGDGRYISATTETIPTSPDADHRFSILASAPATAVSARITLTSTGKEAWVDKLSLRVAVTDK